MNMLPYEVVDTALTTRNWFPSGDSMIAEVVANNFGIYFTDPGYTYFRPHLSQSFDPGWRGPQVRGPEDANTADFGNDPIGLIERMEVALKGWCTAECEEQLQHTLTTHLRSRYAKADVNVEEVQGAMEDYTGPEKHQAAVFLHYRLAELIDQYSEARKTRTWFPGGNIVTDRNG
jgi:hypothetical protein